MKFLKFGIGVALAGSLGLYIAMGQAGAAGNPTSERSTTAERTDQVRIADSHVQDNVVNVPEGDREMAAAIAKARRTLPEFWKALESPKAGEGNFALKVKIVDGDQTEHFWVSSIDKSGSKILGTIDNEPKYVMTVKIGERYAFSEDDISDWLYMRNNKMVGNETLRPLLKLMPKAQADQYRALYEKP